MKGSSGRDLRLATPTRLSELQALAWINPEERRAPRRREIGEGRRALSAQELAGYIVMNQRKSSLLLVAVPHTCAPEGLGSRTAWVGISFLTLSVTLSCVPQSYQP